MELFLCSQLFLPDEKVQTGFLESRFQYVEEGTASREKAKLYIAALMRRTKGEK